MQKGSADMLSTALLETTHGNGRLQDEAETLVEISVSKLPAKKYRPDVHSRHRALDPICSKLIDFCRHGWPEKHSSPELKFFWREQGEPNTFKDLLMYGSRIIVPSPYSGKQATNFSRVARSLPRNHQPAGKELLYLYKVNEMSRAKIFMEGGSKNYDGLLQAFL